MRDKTVTLQEAAKIVSPGATLGLGGLMLRRHPMALIREMVRRRVRRSHTQTWVGGIDVDLLVGAGCVRRVEAAYEGLGPLGIAPNVRRAAAERRPGDRGLLRDPMIRGSVRRRWACRSSRPGR